MARTTSVTTIHDGDEDVIQRLAAALRANGDEAKQLRRFAATASSEPRTHGINFQPAPGQILACHFGLGFKEPEMVKTRPVIVISPKQSQWSRLCVVLPISSRAPRAVRPYHLRLPPGLVPGGKYKEAWIKGDLVIAVGCHRLDRFKIGFRNYVAPLVSRDILQEARRCVLHATGMHALTAHW